MNKPKHYLFLIVTIIAAVIVLMTSCYTPHKADRQLAKAFNHYPDKVAEYARNKFPCITIKSDTIVDYRDSVVVVDCPDTSTIVHDSLVEYVAVNKVVKVPIHLPIEVRTITIKIEDSAKIKLLTSQLTEKDITIEKQTNNNHTLQAKLTHRNKQLAYTLSILILLLILLGFRIYTKYLKGKYL